MLEYECKNKKKLKGSQSREYDMKLAMYVFNNSSGTVRIWHKVNF